MMCCWLRAVGPKQQYQGTNRHVMCARCRFSIATTPSLQDGIAKELIENGLLAHGEDREPRLPEYSDLPKLPFLTAVRFLHHAHDGQPIPHLATNVNALVGDLRMLAS